MRPVKFLIGRLVVQEIWWIVYTKNLWNFFYTSIYSQQLWMAQRDTKNLATWYFLCAPQPYKPINIYIFFTFWYPRSLKCPISSSSRVATHIINSGYFNLLLGISRPIYELSAKLYVSEDILFIKVIYNTDRVPT